MRSEADIGDNAQGDTGGGGRSIWTLETPDGFPALMYAKIVQWGETHGLPSDDDYRARLAVAYPPTGKRGHPKGMSFKRLRLAETARLWRVFGYTERTIAFGLVWEREGLPSADDVEPLNQKVKLLEKDLCDLETREGISSPPRPIRDTAARRQAQEIAAAATQAGDRFHRRREHVVSRGGWPDEDPKCLRLHATYLRLQVKALGVHDVALQDSRRGTTGTYRQRELAEREDMLTTASRFERWAAVFADTDPSPVKTLTVDTLTPDDRKRLRL